MALLHGKTQSPLSTRLAISSTVYTLRLSCNPDTVRQNALLSRNLSLPLMAWPIPIRLTKISAFACLSFPCSAISTSVSDLTSTLVQRSFFLDDFPIRYLTSVRNDVTLASVVSFLELCATNLSARRHTTSYVTSVCTDLRRKASLDTFTSNSPFTHTCSPFPVCSASTSSFVAAKSFISARVVATISPLSSSSKRPRTCSDSIENGTPNPPSFFPKSNAVWNSESNSSTGARKPLFRHSDGACSPTWQLRVRPRSSTIVLHRIHRNDGPNLIPCRSSHCPLATLLRSLRTDVNSSPSVSPCPLTRSAVPSACDTHDPSTIDLASHRPLPFSCTY